MGGGNTSGSCEDDWSWADEDGDACDWYDYNADSCGYYGDGAWDACCACGGGMGGGNTGGSCEDDWSWADDYGDQCDWYYGMEDSCGYYGDGAWDACCACGGGMGGGSGWSDYSDWDDDYCEDDWSWADSYGDQCDWYDWNADSCGYYGDGAWDACCACGGGMGGGWSDSDSDSGCEDDWSWADSYGDQCDWYYD
jgi:hypothetical protein